jgi:PAS domain S-box-containing protein
MPATTAPQNPQDPAQFLAWIETSSELFWAVDAKGRYTYLNCAWEKLLGYPPSEMLGRLFTDFQPAEVAALDSVEFARHTESPGPHRYETTFRKRDGALVHVLFSSHAMLQEGRVIGWQGIGFDVTERRKAEAALLLSEAQLRTFITHAPTAIAMFDSGLHYLAYSDRWLEDYGLKGQNLIGRHHYDIFPSIRDNEFWKDVHRRCLAGEAIKKDEDTFVGADGRQEWLRWDVRPWYLPSGGIGGILMLTESITGRRRAENELRASEERYRHLADMGFEAIFIHENDIIVELNRALIEILGYGDKSELIGKSGLATVVAPQSRALVVERLKERSTHPIEVWCTRKDGSQFLGETQARDIVYQGRPMRLVNVRDITARKQAQDAIAAEKERLAVTLQSIGDGVIATDTQGRVAIMNTVAEKLTGWRQAEALGHPLGEVFRIVHEISREPCENPVDKVLATGGIIELANHTMLLGRDGQEYVIADSGAPIRDAEGRIIGVVLVFRDTTEKQKFIEAAQRTQKLESLGILAGGIAHDFNNLLGGIFGYIDLVHAKTKDEAQAYHLAKALATIDRARGLTQQLLTFAKGGAPIRKVARLFPFVQETVNFVLSGSAVTARFQVATDLKACNFDRNQIGQVIDNLVINAQQAMPLGGALWVTAENIQLRGKQVESLPAGEYVHIAVRDSGIGIPPEILPRIFDPFFTTKQKGSGLGLATCYSILKQHDGSIEVESESGRGTTFHIYLPVSIQQPEPETQAAPTTSKAGKGIFVLMDDEEVIRETLGEMLSAQGFEVVSFAEGRAALDYLMALPKLEVVAAIMLDLTVPGGMGGREAVVEIRRLSGTVPIFVSSGYAEDPVMSEPERYGVTGSLGKPFRRAELLSLLGKHL